MFPIPFPMLTNPQAGEEQGLGDVPHSIPHADQSPSWRGDWCWRMFPIPFPMLTNPQAGKGTGFGGCSPFHSPFWPVPKLERGRVEGWSPFHSPFWLIPKLERGLALGMFPIPFSTLTNPQAREGAGVWAMFPVLSDWSSSLEGRSVAFLARDWSEWGTEQGSYPKLCETAWSSVK